MNTIVLMGRLARDPETKLTSTQKGQTKVSRFPLVVKRNRTSKAFVVMITAYGNNAEFVEKYLEKGIKIALSGELVISQIKDERHNSFTISFNSCFSSGYRSPVLFTFLAI